MNDGVRTSSDGKVDVRMLRRVWFAVQRWGEREEVEMVEIQLCG